MPCLVAPYVGTNGISWIPVETKLFKNFVMNASSSESLPMIQRTKILAFIYYNQT